MRRIGGAELLQKNLPVAGLLACILPFNTQLNNGLGLPARVLTAQVVEQLLSMLHIGAISSYDIIVLENGIAHVDVPCSWIKPISWERYFSSQLLPG